MKRGNFYEKLSLGIRTWIERRNVEDKQAITRGKNLIKNKVSGKELG